MNTFRTTPLRIIKLDEGTVIFEDVSARVQLMRSCTFFHKQYGKVEITRQMFSEMVNNFNNKTRGIELMIDYAHDSDREAAGWIKSLDVVDNPETKEAELWAEVDWTPEGRRTLADREFAYLSADFDPDYVDNENPSKKYGPVLLGAGLTNRPVIKKMNPAVQLSEYNINDKEKNMDQVEQKPVEASETEKKLGQMTKLMEDMGVESIEELMNAIAELKKGNQSMMEQQQLAERKSKLDKLFAEGKINKVQMDKAIELKGEQFTGFITLAEIIESAMKTDETGNSTSPAPGTEKNDQDPADKLIELSEAMATEKKIGTIEAMQIVLSENPDLKKAYYEKMNQE